jgi:hypothetical protein
VRPRLLPDGLGGRAGASGSGPSATSPEADLATLRPDLAFREQLDLDSMDMLNFVVALHGRTWR